MIVMFGNTGGPLIAGILADKTGSYESGFTILACLAGIGSLFFLFAKKPNPPGARRAVEEEPELTRPLAVGVQP
jgi:hypothetical protein